MTDSEAGRAIASCLVQPLAAIVGAVDVVDRLGDQVAPATRRAIQRIGGSAACVERLVFDLIDLRDAEAGRLLLDRQCTELGPLLSALISVGIAAAERRRIALDIRDAAFALVDRPRIGRVLATLVNHALSHSAGSISVRVERGSDLVRVTVADHGAGLSAAQSRCAFDPHPKHAGVPLYVARKIVEAHGGRINVASQPGHGTKFELVLPSARP
jgi:two-component system, OmpR family, sensor histidine kinase MtrB